MRVAVVTGPVSIPPTYFVVQHALALRDRHRFALFSPRAVVDPALGFETHSAVARPSSDARIDTLRLQTSGATVSRDLRRWAPDLIHQHFATWSLPATSVARRRGVPLVTTLHGYDVMNLSRQSSGVWGAITRRSLRASLTHTTRFLAVSRWLADRAIAGGVPASRLDVLYQGVDTTWFTPGEPRDAPDRPVVLYVGGLSTHKGIEVLLQASAAVHGLIAHDLVIVGHGPLVDRVRAFGAERPHVSVVGSVGRDQLRELYRSATVTVVPSLATPERQEPAGLVALEAQASGVPVIVSRSGGLPEMVRDGTTGTVVEAGDPVALAASLEEWLRMPQPTRRSHAEAARRFVVEERDSTVAALDLDLLYGHLTR